MPRRSGKLASLSKPIQGLRCACEGTDPTKGMFRGCCLVRPPRRFLKGRLAVASDELGMRDRAWSGGGHECLLEERRGGLFVGICLWGLMQMRGNATEPLS